MAKGKISRKKLLQEPDEFLSLTQRIWLWVHEHRDRAAVFAGAIAAAVVVALVAKALVERSRTQRSSSVATAVTRYTQASAGTVSPDVPRELTGLAEKYAGSPEGELARYFGAGALLATGEVDRARKAFETLAAPGAASVNLAALSRVALAYIELSHGSADQALSAFQKLLKTGGATLPRAQIRMEIAVLHEKQGRPADAVRAYKELAAEHPDGPWAAQVKDRLRALSERVPSAS